MAIVYNSSNRNMEQLRVIQDLKSLHLGSCGKNAGVNNIGLSYMELWIQRTKSA